jgi:vitamin K-dependent gamma-carboxylase
MATRSHIERLGAPVDGASLGLFRAGFGLMMLVSIIRFWARGWIEQLYLQPKMFFPYWGFGWIEPWPGVGMYVHFAVLGVLAALIMVGFWSRPASFLFFLGFTYVELIDRTTYLNHYYLISILALLMAFLPVECAFSVRGALRRGAEPCSIPRWSLYVMRMQVGLVYVTAGLAKLRVDWLFRAEPLHTWLLASADMPILGPLLMHESLAFAMSWAGAFFDLFVVAFLLWRPTRRFAYAAVLLFHAVTGVLFPIGVFPIVMSLSATIFFEPDWPRRLFGGHAHNGQPAPVRPSPLTLLQRVGFAVLAAHFAVQIAFPWRQLLYTGNTCWREEGFRFAWHVMLMEKTGQVDFRVVDDRSGKSWVVSPRQSLTPLQVRMMATQPDMILSFAHHLEEAWKQQGYADVSVYADAWASLNGRPRQRLVSPEVDLSEQREGWAPKTWIVPLENR